MNVVITTLSYYKKKTQINVSGQFPANISYLKPWLTIYLLFETSYFKRFLGFIFTKTSIYFVENVLWFTWRNKHNILFKFMFLYQNEKIRRRVLFSAATATAPLHLSIHIPSHFPLNSDPIPYLLPPQNLRLSTNYLIPWYPFPPSLTSPFLSPPSVPNLSIFPFPINSHFFSPSFFPFPLSFPIPHCHSISSLLFLSILSIIYFWSHKVLREERKNENAIEKKNLIKVISK